MPVGQPPEDDEDRPSAAASDRPDPEVLAEHRARRADSEEEHLLARLNRAEQDRVLLATRLAEAEGDLDRARRGQEGLRIDLAARDRELAQARARIEHLSQQLAAARADAAATRSAATAGLERRDALLAEMVAAIDAVRARTDELLERLVPEREVLQEDLRRRVAFERAVRAAVDGLGAGGEEPAAPSPDVEPSAVEALVSARPLPDLAALLPVAPDPETTSLIGDLERAAERLRARVAAEAVVEPAPAEEVVPEEEPVAETAPALPAEDQEALVAVVATAEPAATPEPAAAAEPEPAAHLDRESEPEPAAAAAPAPEPASVQEPAAPIARPEPVMLLPRGVAPTRTGDWLAAGLAELAGRDPARAAQGLLSVLPAHVRRSSHDLAFDLEIEDAGSWQVSRWGPVVAIDPRDAAQVEHPDFTLSGSAPALVPILTGRSRRLRRRVRVGGHRRRLRRLLRELGPPVGLAELAAGPLPDPELVLELLTRAVDPKLTDGHAFLVAYRIEGPSPQALQVVADAAGLRVAGLDPHAGATATVTVADRAFVALLAGLPLPAGTAATVTGSAATVQLLHEWFAAAQESGA